MAALLDANKNCFDLSIILEYRKSSAFHASFKFDGNGTKGKKYLNIKVVSQ